MEKERYNKKMKEFINLQPENAMVQIFNADKMKEYQAIIDKIMNKKYNIKQGKGITATDLLNQLLTQILSIHIPNRKSYARIVEDALPILARQHIDAEKQLETQDNQITKRDLAIITGSFDVSITINKDEPTELYIKINTY